MNIREPVQSVSTVTVVKGQHRTLFIALIRAGTTGQAGQALA